MSETGSAVLKPSPVRLHPSALPQLLAGGPIWFIVRRGGRDRTTGVACRREHHALAREVMLSALKNPLGCELARGKVVVVDDRTKTLFVEQISTNRDPQLVACGHASAVGCLLLAPSPMSIHLPRGTVHASVAISDDHEIQAVWTLPPASIHEIICGGVRVLQLNGLNTYRVIGPQTPPHVLVALERWVRLASDHKLVVLGHDGATADFRNADGTHNSAPLTGLITLAVAREYGLIAIPEMLTVRGRREVLPSVKVGPTEIIVEMPACSVMLAGHEVDASW